MGHYCDTCHQAIRSLNLRPCMCKGPPSGHVGNLRPFFPTTIVCARLITMCYYTVDVTHYGCGHTLPFSQPHLVSCSNRNCTSSPQHPLSCQGPACRESCMQVLDHSQEWAMLVASAFCPMCHYVEELLTGRHYRCH